MGATANDADEAGEVKVSAGKGGRTRRYFTPDDKFRIVLEALESGKASDVIKARGLHQNVFYRWRQTFFDGAKRALAGVADASPMESDLVRQLREENAQLKAAVGDLYMKLMAADPEGLGAGTGRVYFGADEGEDEPEEE